MTATIFLLTIGLVALHFALSGRSTHLAQHIALLVAGITSLPFAFGPFIPIAHFIFESTNKSLLWAAQAVCSLLLIALVSRLAVRWRDGEVSNLRLPISGIVVGQTVLLGAAILLSDFEPGAATPTVWDAPVYVLEWLTGIIMCLLLALAAWRTGGSGLAFRMPTAGYLLILGLLASGTVAP